MAWIESPGPERDVEPVPYNFTRTALDDMAIILNEKATDYSANSSDPYVNFKHTAKIVGINPEQVALVLAGVKLSRISQLMNSGASPINESLHDSFLDLANYATLAYAMHLESMKNA